MKLQTAIPQPLAAGTKQREPNRTVLRAFSALVASSARHQPGGCSRGALSTQPGHWPQSKIQRIRRFRRLPHICVACIKELNGLFFKMNLCRKRPAKVTPCGKAAGLRTESRSLLICGNLRNLWIDLSIGLSKKSASIRVDPRPIILLIAANSRAVLLGF